MRRLIVAVTFSVSVFLGCYSGQPIIYPPSMPEGCKDAIIAYKPGSEFAKSAVVIAVGAILDVKKGSRAEICAASSEALELAESERLNEALLKMAAMLRKYVGISYTIAASVMELERLVNLNPANKVHSCDKEWIIDLCKRIKLLAC